MYLQPQNSQQDTDSGAASTANMKTVLHRNTWLMPVMAGEKILYFNIHSIAVLYLGKGSSQHEPRNIKLRERAASRLSEFGVNFV